MQLRDCSANNFNRTILELRRGFDLVELRWRRGSSHYRASRRDEHDQYGSRDDHCGYDQHGSRNDHCGYDHSSGTEVGYNLRWSHDDMWPW